MMTELNPNPVIKRIIVKAPVWLSTPALLGSGEHEDTDRDVLLVQGMPMLTGTTLAGVLRSEVNAFCTEDANKLFGSKENGGDMSPLWVYDVPLEGNRVTLDGVALDYENKTALEKKKYDMEAVAAGAKGILRLELEVRKNDDCERLEKTFRRILAELHSGNISVGAKANRGFGCLSCPDIQEQSFEVHEGAVAELKRWENFDWNTNEAWEPTTYTEGFDSMSTLTARLLLDSSLMIRDTRNLEGTEDYKHISMGEQAVIYGTSWAGAFRAGLYKLLRMKLEKPEAEEYLERYFGFVHEEDLDTPAKPSQIRFAASVFGDETTDTGYRLMTRVAINRFTGGAAEGMLFTERPWVGGATTLKIRFPKGSEEVRKLLLLALDAMDKKILTVGGETSVGRGVFKVTGVDIDGEPVERFRKGGEPA